MQTERRVFPKRLIATAILACVPAVLAPASACAQSAFQHHQAMMDIAATPPWDYDDYGEEDDDPSYSVGEWRDWSYAPPVVLDSDTIATLAKYREFMDGSWFHDMSGEDACVATFMRQGSGAMAVALGGRDDWALLGVFSPTAPRPSTMQTIQVSLTQTGDPPASVSAFSLPLAWDRDHSGLIVFAVPSAGALIDGLLDAQSFDVAIQGKSVAQVAWTGGLAARAELAACIAGRS
jgi:hypothetical protein